MVTSAVLMIRPVNFNFNPETAVNNSFQKKMNGNIKEKALAEFNGLYSLLIQNKIAVTVIEDTDLPATPDAVFPNNWISFHEDNSIFMYPMFALNRRMERKEHVLRKLQEQFIISKSYDLSSFEQQSAFLEGTGSMVLDRDYKIAYASVSQRTDERVLYEFCRLSGYRPMLFTSHDDTGKEIYHTNVMMAVGEHEVLICMDAIAGDENKERLQFIIKKTGKKIVPISIKQLHHFAGNMLQLKNSDGDLLWVMSETAFRSLTETQVQLLEENSRLLYAPLNIIETCGGGSARCMLAEIFNDPR